MFVDTHLHVSDTKFDLDRDAVIERARAAGVTTLVEIAESPATWDAAVALTDKYPGIYASLGIHPHHAHEAGPDRWPELSKRLRELLKNPKVVAIGEFGLDYFRMRNTKEQQDYLFRQQLDLAKEQGKPIVIHCRNNQTSSPAATGHRGLFSYSSDDHRQDDWHSANRDDGRGPMGSPPETGGNDDSEQNSSAHADVQKALAEYYPQTSYEHTSNQPPGVIHCFSGTWEDAQMYLLHGFMLGIDGPVTYPNSQELKENVARLPLERLVLETDSPYLPPQDYRGQRNEPSYIPIIAEAVSSLRHKTPKEVARQTTANAKALFRLP